MLLVALIISVILFLYVLLIISFSFGWRKMKSINKQNFFPIVSVVICMRNEEKEIAHLLKSLKSQIYPTDKLEFILVNDHSIDDTLDLLEKSDLDNCQILNMPEGEFGKKNAIRLAVSTAIGDIILASDADCIFNPNWVRTMCSYFENNDIKLVSGPVSFNQQEGVFQSLQALEFTSLIASGAGAIGINNPIFCNGANMAYRKETFLEVNSFKNDNVVSGDDVFLLHNIKAKYPNSIIFSKDKNALVSTNSAQTFRDFINQRKRWASKSSGYKDKASIYVSYLVLLLNLSFVFLFIISFLDIFLFKIFILFYLIKFIVDLLLLFPVLIFFSREDLIKWVFPFELFYSFYIIFTVILSFAQKFEWKGRMYKK